MTMDDALLDPLAWVQARADAWAGDPVRLRVLQGLARRAAGQSGLLRRQLIDKLMRRAEETPQPLAARLSNHAPSPLAELVAQLHAAGPELRNVTAHRRTWSALRAHKRMAEVSAPVPEHLGPLNSQVLVTRALQQLQGLAPDYLQRLLTQLDTLAALAPLAAPPEADKPTRPARPTAKKPTPRKR